MAGFEERIRSRRVGRPRSLQPRDLITKVRLNEEEDAIVSSVAAAACLPVATYLRHRALGNVKIPAPRTDVETAAQLARVGNLLNQAIALAHSGRVVGWPVDDIAELQNLCAEIARALVGQTATE